MTATFNPANFSTAAAKARQDRAAAPVSAVSDTARMVAELEKAAARFALRRDSFAEGKSDTCLDLASKLEHFGSFASERQAKYAADLIEWSKPRQAAPAAAPRAPAASELPKLFGTMQRLTHLHIGKLTIARKNQDTLCWVKHEDCERVIGKIEGGELTLWRRDGIDQAAVAAALASIEADPQAAAAAHGKASGRCAVCNRDLTDPESIAIGIGPICRAKF